MRSRCPPALRSHRHRRAVRTPEARCRPAASLRAGATRGRRAARAEEGGAHRPSANRCPHRWRECETGSSERAGPNRISPRPLQLGRSRFRLSPAGRLLRTLRCCSCENPRPRYRGSALSRRTSIRRTRPSECERARAEAGGFRSASWRARGACRTGRPGVRVQSACGRCSTNRAYLLRLRLGRRNRIDASSDRIERAGRNRAARRDVRPASRRHGGADSRRRGRRPTLPRRGTTPRRRANRSTSGSVLRVRARWQANRCGGGRRVRSDGTRRARPWRA